MILLLNIFVPVVCLLLTLLAYKKKKLWPVTLAVLIFGVYPLIQPSYMPKGTVKSLPNAEFQTVDKPIVDRQLKPKSAEQYDAERKEALELIDKSLKEQIASQKERVKSLKE